MAPPTPIQHRVARDEPDDGVPQGVRTPNSMITRGPWMSRSRSASIASLVLALILALVGVVAGARSAAAHAQLVSSNPADGSALQEMPQHVEFEFNENINPSFAQVVVIGADQRNRAIDNVTVEGPTVTAAVPTDLTEGQVVARFRVVSADGHPIAGEISFTVGEASEAAQTDRQQNPTAAAVPNAEEPADIEAAPSSQQAPNVAPYALMGLAAAIMIAFGVFLLVAERRKR